MFAASRVSRAVGLRAPVAQQVRLQSGFTNKYNFNMLPPPTHAYWNIRNSSIYVVFVPLFFAVAYVGKELGSSTTVHLTLLEFADDEKSPLKGMQFGEPQLRK